MGILACVVAAFALWFFTLDARHLLSSDEGRYAEIAREMLASGDWVTTRYNGVVYFEKPPFETWMTALAFKAFGVGEWQSRLWVALAGATGMLATGAAAARWFGRRVGILAVLVLLAAPGWNLASHFNSLDMGLSGALACTLAALLAALHPRASPAASRNLMWTAWAAMAVATLTKGLVGVVLPGMVVLAYVVVTRQFGLLRRLRIASGLAIFLALCAPWFVLVSARNPEFAQFFFIHEHFQRYLLPEHHRPGAWWYFLPQLAVGLLPWLGLARAAWSEGRAERRDPEFRPRLFCLVWAATIFLFFSLSKSKLPGYILPVYPALAVLLALPLARFGRSAWSVKLACAFVFLLVLCSATPLLPRFGSSSTPAELYVDYQPWLVAASALGVAGMVVAWHLNRTGDTLRSVAVYALVAFAVMTVALRGHEVFGHERSGIDLVPVMAPYVQEAAEVYSVRMLDHTLPFYLQRPMTMVESPDELEFGLRQEPARWLPTIDAFVDAWGDGRKSVALMSPETFRVLQQRGLPMDMVVRDRRRVVVANFVAAAAPGPVD